MKKVLWIIIASSLISCGMKNEKSNYEEPDSTLNHQQHNHDHYYKVYTGEINYGQQSPINDTFFRSCTFNNLPNKYFITDKILSNPTNSSFVKVYKYISDSTSEFEFDKNIIGKDTIIISINILPNNIEDDSIKSGKSSFGKGSLGCIPKFNEDSKGNLLSYFSNKKRYLPLMLAYHLKIYNEIVYFLINYNFEISDDCYQVLNEYFMANKLMEGGISKGIKNEIKIESDTLKIYGGIANKPIFQILPDKECHLF